MKSKLTIISLFLLLTCAPTVSAQELDLSDVPMTPTPAPVEYELPYPGVLPGHFLYSLKEVRDSLMSFLISNPTKKAEFNLLQSDKRMQAAFILLERDEAKADLAKQTVAQSQDYFADALKKIAAAKRQGMETSDLTRRLVLAEQKHREVLGVMVSKLEEDDKEHFADAKSREKEFANKVKQLKP